MKQGKQKTYHQVLIAKNNTGYKNLLKLNSIAYKKGFYYKPRVDFELLSKHSEGLIVLSACLAGEIPKKLLADDYDGAKAVAKKYIDVLYLYLVSNNNKFVVNETSYIFISLFKCLLV